MSGRIQKYKKVIGVGYACVDQLISWKSVKKPVAGNMIVDYDIQGGGMVATGLVAVTRLGGRAEFWGTAGRGPMGDLIVNELKQEKVDTSQVLRIKGGDGPVCLACVDSVTGERYLFHGKSPAARERSLGRLERIKSAGCLLVDGSHMKTALRACTKAGKLGIPVVGDVGYFKKGLEKLICHMDYAIASEKFAETLAGKRDFKRACRILTDMGACNAVVTLGQKGLIGYDLENFIKMPAFRVPVADTTGAGDTFHGAFCFGLTRGLSFEVNLRFSSAVAALKCRKLGGRAGIPKINEVVRFLRTHACDMDRGELERLRRNG